MCNYADDIKTLANGSLEGVTNTGPAQASINPATSGVTAGSGPDMWEPVSLVQVGNGDLLSTDGFASAFAFDAVTKPAGIGSKKILFGSGIAGRALRVLFVLKTGDLGKLDAVGIPPEEVTVIANLDPSDYRGGGKHRRRFRANTADFSDNTPLYMVERNTEWATSRGEPYFIDPMANMGRGAAFVLLSDEATKKG